MRRVTLLIACAAALAAPGPALAGGWATASLSEPPDGLRAGQEWRAEVEVLQHGVTPLDGVEPSVALRNARTGERRSFAAKPAGRAGIYVASVSPPSAGGWRVEVDDGFGGVHRMPALEVAAAAPAESGSGWLLPAVLGLGVLAVAGARLRKRLLTTGLLVLVALAVAAAAATAKGLPGERIVEIAPAPPSDLAAGEPWRLTVTIRDHRDNLVEGPPPKLGAIHLGSRETRDFQAHATRSDGVWRFTAQFPTAGPWQYEVEDGMGQNHRFPPVTVAAAATAQPDDGDASGTWALLGIASLGAVALSLLRRARGGAPPPPAPAGSR